MDKVKIISDGTIQGTVVLGADGVPIKGIKRIEIYPIIPGGPVEVNLTFDVELDVTADVEAFPKYPF